MANIAKLRGGRSGGGDGAAGGAVRRAAANVLLKAATAIARAKQATGRPAWSMCRCSGWRRKIMTWRRWTRFPC